LERCREEEGGRKVGKGVGWGVVLGQVRRGVR